MDVQALIKEYSLSVKRSLDQHFVIDEAILDKEIELAGLKKGDVALDVGAGIGNLTKRIAARCRAIAIERDAQFLPLLNTIENAEIIHGDALTAINRLAFNKIVSNIPYSISQPLLLELLKHKWDIAVLLVQKEFALKMLSKSKLAVLVNDCCFFNIDSFVPGGAFYPPTVDSALVTLKQKRLLDAAFWKFLSRIYMQKNRNVKNVVDAYPQDMARKKVHQLGAKELKTLHEMNKK